MGILSGVVSYLFGLALNLLDATINGFLGALGFDLDTFEHYFPAAAMYHDVIVGFAVGLLFILLLFQLFRNFGVMLDMEAEDPLKILGKTALFLGMIVCSRSIVNLILRLMADPYDIFLNAAPTPYEFELLTLVTAMFDSVYSNPFVSIVAVILMLVLGWQFLKLTLECVERYIVFYFGLYCAPVVFATGAFKSTAQIFKSWCRMVGSQAMLLLINIWSIKLFLSFMPVFESNSQDIVFNFLLGFAFLKFAQKADTLLRILGLNTASTGDMVRSLGGAIAGIAMTIRTAGGMAQRVVSAVGQRYGATHSSDTKGAAGRSGESASSEGVGGMRASPQPNDGPSSPKGDTAAGGITATGISSAKQGFVTDVMHSAHNQMYGSAQTTTQNQRVSSTGEQSSDESNESQRNVAKDIESNIAMESGKSVNEFGDFGKLDEETTEGLSNLAHGLPHDQFDMEQNRWTGGGFPEFTGEDANLIGASQLEPADGYSRFMMKMSDGSTGTVYRNNETGEAHVVQFASVDNGVMQGTIAKIDPENGKMGEDFAFRAVHSSVPGAETFSSHAVAVQTPSGGSYHIATGAETTMFSSVDDKGQSIGSSYTPGGTNHIDSTIVYTADAANRDMGSGKFSGEMPAQAGLREGGINNLSDQNSTAFVSPATEGQSISSSQNTVAGETPMSTRTDPPPINTGMEQPHNQVRRFSKNNPANLEVFRKENSQVETFDKVGSNLESNSDVTPLKNN